MDFVKLIELFSMICVMIGVPLISTPRIEGLYFMLLGQFGWITFAFLKGDQQFFLVQGIFLQVWNFIGIYNWRKKGVGVTKE